MNKKILINLFLSFFMFSLGTIAQEEMVVIPEEVKSVLEEGLAAREGRQDISICISYHLYFPAQQNIHAIFFIKMKNSDLDYSPLRSSSETEQAAEERSSTLQSTEVQQETQLQANFNIFLQIYQVKKRGKLQALDEICVPASVQAESSSYDPEKEEIYSFGFPLPAGKYLLALAITSVDLQKIGTTYFEFTPVLAPETMRIPTGYQTYSGSQTIEGIGITPILFVKKHERMEAPERKIIVHKGYFTYSILKIFPNLDYVIKEGEDLDIMFYIIGARPNKDGRLDIEISYRVYEKEKMETLIRWTLKNYDYPFVSQVLPLKQIVIDKSDVGEMKKEINLPAGNYTLDLTIKDKAQGFMIHKWIDFEVK